MYTVLLIVGSCRFARDKGMLTPKRGDTPGSIQSEGLPDSMRVHILEVQPAALVKH